MRPDIHPQYFDRVEIRCSCGNIVVCGSTREKLKTELCSKCHPFYTGQQKLVDTAGRVDKFQAKRLRATAFTEERKQRQLSKQKKTEIYKEKEVPLEVLRRAGALPKKKEGKWGAPLGKAPAEEIVKEEIIEKKKAGAKKKPAAKKVAKKAVKKKKTAAQKPAKK